MAGPLKRRYGQLQFMIVPGTEKKPRAEKLSDNQQWLRAVTFLSTHPNSNVQLQEIQKCAQTILKYYQRYKLEQIAAEVQKLGEQLQALQEPLHYQSNETIPLPLPLLSLSHLVHLEVNMAKDCSEAEKIGHFTSIVTLFWTLKATQVPASVGNCTALKLLAIGNGEVQELPPSIKNLTRLRELTVMEQKLKDLPPELKACTLLKTLNLRSNKIVVFPAIITQLTQLQEIDLQDNLLGQVSCPFGLFIHLERLNLSLNLLKSWPDIFACASLTDLDMSGNPLQTIPAAICQLTGLRILQVASIQLKLPFELGGLTALNKLNISHNYLAELPVTALHALEELDCSFNRIVALPLAVCRMSKLQRIILEGNPLQEIKVT